MTKQEIINKRQNHLCYEEAINIQKQLINIYKNEYKPKHTAKTYLKLILDWNVSEIEETHPQSNNYVDKVFRCFSVVSQRVYGYTKEHCLDQIYDELQKKKQRIKDYKKLPTLNELVNSNINVNPDKMYSTREKNDPDDSCSGFSGDIILEMREIGIDKYREKSFNNWIANITK